MAWCLVKHGDNFTFLLYHSPLSSAEVKNAWSLISTPQYVFMEWCLIKYRNNLPYYSFIGLQGVVLN